MGVRGMGVCGAFSDAAPTLTFSDSPLSPWCGGTLFFRAQIVNCDPDEKPRKRQFDPPYLSPVLRFLVLPGLEEAEDPGLESDAETGAYHAQLTAVRASVEGVGR